MDYAILSEVAVSRVTVTWLCLTLRHRRVIVISLAAAWWPEGPATCDALLRQTVAAQPDVPVIDISRC
jgi:hypothetical protein